jgi:hypothetical protein
MPLIVYAVTPTLSALPLFSLTFLSIFAVACIVGIIGKNAREGCASENAHTTQKLFMRTLRAGETFRLFFSCGVHTLHERKAASTLFIL